MSVPFKYIPLDTARPGMVLSDDLLDANGHILLRRGLVLTASILASLRRHQIDNIAIADAACGDIDASAALVRHEQRLATLFRKPGNDKEDATGILYHYVLHYRTGEPE